MNVFVASELLQNFVTFSVEQIGTIQKHDGDANENAT